MILRDNLAGNSETAIICTINPLEKFSETTKNTLEFANNAGKVKTFARVYE